MNYLFENTGPRELTGAVDLINHYKLSGHHDFFCKRSLPLSVADTHYLHNVVGDTEIRKGEGMELGQLFLGAPYLRESTAQIQQFDLEILGQAFQLRDTAPIDLPMVRTLSFQWEDAFLLLCPTRVHFVMFCSQTKEYLQFLGNRKEILRTRRGSTESTRTKIGRRTRSIRSANIAIKIGVKIKIERKRRIEVDIMILVVIIQRSIMRRFFFLCLVCFCKLLFLFCLSCYSWICFLNIYVVEEETWWYWRLRW